MTFIQIWKIPDKWNKVVCEFKVDVLQLKEDEFEMEGEVNTGDYKEDSKKIEEIFQPPKIFSVS